LSDCLISDLVKIVWIDEATKLKNTENDTFYDTNWSFFQGRGRVISLLPFP